MRAMLPLSARTREAIKTGLAMVIVYAIAMQMGWDKPYWAGVYGGDDQRIVGWYVAEPGCRADARHAGGGGGGAWRSWACFPRSAGG